MSRKTILLVDDSSTILMMETFILRNHPYDLVTATDGEEAVQKARSLMPDLIILDVVMPRMSGIEASRILSTDPRTSHIPIMLTLTRAEAASIDGGHLSGCHDCITKPISAVELLEKVRSILGEDDEEQAS